jgi:flagellar basal body-associated protein FliL
MKKIIIIIIVKIKIIIMIRIMLITTMMITREGSEEDKINVTCQLLHGFAIFSIFTYFDFDE